MLSSEVFTLSMQTRDATTGAKRHIGYCIDSVNPSLERRGSERTLPSSRRQTVRFNDGPGSRALRSGARRGPNQRMHRTVDTAMCFLPCHHATGDADRYVHLDCSELERRIKGE